MIAQRITVNGLSANCLATSLPTAKPWFSNAHLQTGGVGLDGFMTRHMPPAPAPISLSAYVGLKTPQLRWANCIHEAGHAVVGRHALGPVHEMVVYPDGRNDAGAAAATFFEDWQAGWIDYAIMLAAGEQAQIRWLRRAGLYNERRGWLAELQSHGDRLAAKTTAANGQPLTVSFGRPGTATADWSELTAEADRRLSQRWDTVTELATALDRYGNLKATDIERIIG